MNMNFLEIRFRLSDSTFPVYNAIMDKLNWKHDEITFLDILKTPDPEYALSIHNDNNIKDLQKYMDKAVSKGLIKKNTANREKSRINEKIKNMK